MLTLRPLLFILSVLDVRLTVRLEGSWLLVVLTRRPPLQNDQEKLLVLLTGHLLFISIPFLDVLLTVRLEILGMLVVLTQ